MTQTGFTPLHHVVENGHTEMTSYLLCYGADPMAVDNEKNTPLHIAAIQGHAAIARMLLQTGKVQVNAHNKLGTGHVLCVRGVLQIFLILMSVHVHPLHVHFLLDALLTD